MRSAWLLLLFLCATAPAAAAQWPGELAGRVRDAATGDAVPAATVEVQSLGRSTATDATGGFYLRGLEPGSYRIRIGRPGYAEHTEMVEIHNGRVVRLIVALSSVAVELPEIGVVAPHSAATGGVPLDRAAIRQSGARSIGDILVRVPGVVVRGRGADQQQTASIRGSGADAVLVLVDGIAINDPVTGEADLSTVPAHQVESVTVLPGAQSARYGPRAEAGVILIRTREPAARLEAALAAGTLGERAAAGEWGGVTGPLGWSVGGQVRGSENAFRYARVPGADERRVLRANADVEQLSAFAAGGGALAGGELRLRAGAETLERGLPGKGYAPSLHARQTLDRVRGGLNWQHTGNAGAAAVALSAVSQNVRFADPAPPFGLPYDDHTRFRLLGTRAEVERFATGPGLRSYGAGLDGTLQHIDAGGLSERTPRTRLDGGVFAHAATGAEWGSNDLEFAADLRLDRDDLADRWYPSRALTLRLDRGPFQAHLANRSSFSPPSLGDQFFREGVAVAPNPELRPERVPSEWEIGAALSGSLLGANASAGGTLYRGDVEGMIVWTPDFRFVWSPQNIDVDRWGSELWAEAEWPERALRFAASHSLAAVTYERRSDAPAVQVVYRPRHTAQFRAEWSPGAWRTGVGALYLGARNPDPSAANTLPGFWTLDLNLAREWSIGRWRLDSALHIDRLRGETDTLIFGFPEPGRRIRVDLRIRRADPSSSSP